MEISDFYPVIAAIRNDEDLEYALESDADIIFHLASDILTLKADIEKAHSHGKKIFVHIDLAEGIGKDASGISYMKALSTDGIISTRVNLIKTARELGLSTVQRFFIVDSHSIDTTIDAVKSSKPDMVELMPGLLTKVITQIKKEVRIPIIAGGLIESKSEIISAINAGADAVSTGKRALWQE